MKKIILINLFLLFISMLFSVESTTEGILFSYNGKAKSVLLVGSMNEWNENGIKMENSNEVWGITIKLSPGKHTYKFIIDGNWEYDISNPSFEDDGYGGMNSILEINQNGQIINSNKISTNKTISSFNKKITFKGRYLSDNRFYKNTTKRFMLDTPEHDLNLGINIEFNSDFTGYTVLNVNNTKEGTDLWKTHFNYKRTYLRFEADYVNVVGFDNFGMFNFNNPSNMIGGIGYNNYDFGYDYSGVYIETSDKVSTHFPFSVKGQFIFADKIGFEEDDITSMRISLSTPRINNNLLTLGGSNFQYRVNLSDQYIIQTHNSNELDFSYEKSFVNPSWKNPMKLNYFFERYYYENTNSNQDSSEVWMDGENIFLGVGIQFPSALKIYWNHLISSFELPLEEIDFSRNKITIGADFKLKKFHWNLSGEFWKDNFDNNFSWSNFYEHVARTNANGRWFQEYSELPFEKYTILGYEDGILWYSDLRFIILDIKTSIKNKLANRKLFSNPNFIESVVIFEYDLSSKWKFKTDTRIPYYNDYFLDIKTDFDNNYDVFISNYSEIVYYLSEDAWLSIGYGVNPKVINPVSDLFYNRGREDYLNYAGQLSEHLDLYYVGLGDKIRNAEQLLMDEKSISIQAVIEF